MCGIFGAVNGSRVTSLLLNGLQSLEYRGYDSAGLAVLHNGQIELRRAPGKLSNLQQVLEANPTDGRIGIAHTRWATHGVPSETNAHPHATDRVAVVHNGIVENYVELRAELAAGGAQFRSQTDSEVIPHLVTHYLEQGLGPLAAVRAATSRLAGTFALGVMFSGKQHFLITARRGSPLAVGLGDHANFIASDGLALAPVAPEYFLLEEGDHAVITQERVSVYDGAGDRVTRKTHASKKVIVAASKNDHRHYMHKEIFEQPAALRETVRRHTQIDATPGHATALSLDLSGVKRIQIVGCGTSYYAGLVAKYWFEQLAKLPVDVDIASEFRYREPVLQKDGAVIVISQSGETADTLAALRFARSHGQRTFAVVNVAESSIAREADAALETYAGPEIGVASTKAFTTQLAVLALLAVNAGRSCGLIDATKQQEMIDALCSLTHNISSILEKESILAELAQRVAKADNALFLSRGSCYPIALEGALKIKEVSYLHAEGYAAGELKHGPIALVDENVPVIVIAPDNVLRDKTNSNVREVMARRGQVFLVTTDNVESELADAAEGCFRVSEGASIWSPLLYVVPLQLLAYHVALARGTDVDQPRNLAKSVTVE